MMTAIRQRSLRYVYTSFLLSLAMPASVFAFTTWQGPYLGVYAGGGFGNNKMSTNAGSVTSTSYFTTSADINAVNNSGSWTKNPNTLIAGIQAGHDWAWQQMVYGLVFDYGKLTLSSSKTISNVYPSNSGQYSLYTSMKTNWLFTLRGRAGYQTTVHLIPSLFYLTGGMAVTQLNVKNNFNDNSVFAGAGASNTSQNQIGWTAGAGVEIALCNNLSMDFEYLYVQIPSVKTMTTIFNSEGGFGIPANSLSSPLTTTTNLYANMLKIGLNYRFN